MAGDKERCMAAGMDGYLAKPVRPDDLAAAISEWLPAAAPSAPEAPEAPLAPEEGALDGERSLGLMEANATPAEDAYRPLVDRRQFDLMRNLDGEGSSAFVVELVDAFIDEGAVEVKALWAAVAAHDAGALMQGAHRLKGSSLNLGCGALAETASALESIGRGGTVDGAGPLLDRLGREFDRTAAALRVEVDAA
jgi:HPt (histidine-containing phosphotransfer) domain-containing protein